MRWKDGRRSSNVEDRRGMAGPSSAMGGAGGLLRLLPLLLGTKGGRRIIIIGVLVFIAAKFMGIDLLQLVSGGAGVARQQTTELTEADREMGEFVSVVLADTEDTWDMLFKQLGGTYEKPTLVLFRNTVNSGCGFAQAAMGPFYCPADKKLYIDLSFYEDMRNKLGAPGDFAQAYVIAHEVGHHVQTLLGISQQVHQARSKVSETKGNQLSVKQELQADCFAGIWGHHAHTQRELLDDGDIEEALIAAAAIGDDALQRQAGGAVRPETFTHGTSAQRVEWFKRGFSTGTIESCDTFK